MKLLTAQQIKDWDSYTIQHEPIASADLMERAAKACIQPLLKFHKQHDLKSVVVFCGPGNNGGDGFAIARLMLGMGFNVDVYQPRGAALETPDCKLKKNELIDKFPDTFHLIQSGEDFPPLTDRRLMIIDALFGIGMTKSLEGLVADLVRYINQSGEKIVSIDLPSGLTADPIDNMTLDRAIIQATKTLTLQLPKKTLLLTESGEFGGEVEVIDIHLDPDYMVDVESNETYITQSLVKEMIRTRPKFSHKGTFGHLLTIGGSFGMMGAPILMSKAAVRTGCGLVTSHVPKVGYSIMQSAIPECLVTNDEGLTEMNSFPKNLGSYQAICVGPGMGTHESTMKALLALMPRIEVPSVFDADALNCLNKAYASGYRVPPFTPACILTPHPKEFDRLAGKSSQALDRLNKQREYCMKHKVTMVLKGAHSTVVNPEGKIWFNSSGNPGLATAGSGDVLTGILGSLLAQGYDASESAILGVYLHGYCADLLAKDRRVMTASDIIEMIPLALHKITA